ncbi:MAG: Flp family type IVb pilin [Nitrosospira sp.]|nr:Flp family type IVb pilin [Nitrosospira sp.]
MNKIIHEMKRFLNDEEGVTAIEYGLIAALIAVFIIGSVTLVGGQLAAVFAAVSTALTTAL